MTPLVSVVIPTYNRAGYLREAIESVRAQTFGDWELLIVDDASTDGTRELVESYAQQSPHIRYLWQDNRERAAARNAGIRAAQGQYVALLDSDDVWLPQHLERCLEEFRGCPEAGVVYSGSYFVDADGRIVGRQRLRRPQGTLAEQMVATYNSGGCNASSCVAQRYVFSRVGVFNEDPLLSGSEDWELWVRLAAQAIFRTTRVHTVHVRLHRGMSSAQTERMRVSMTKALDLIYANADVCGRLAPVRARAYSSLYTTIAINDYAEGNMRSARNYLRRAALADPWCVLRNPYVAYTWMRSLLGRESTRLARRLKAAVLGKWLEASSKSEALK